MGELHGAAEALRDRLESSPLIGWLKDLDGRYVYINRGYVDQLQAAADSVLGHVDSELPPREAIDGPRLQNGGHLADEPIQFEYRVAAFEGRPALAVLRFPVRDGDGTPVGVCGVAAPIAQAQLVREECSELMGLETASSGNGGETAAELEQERRRVAALHEASASAARRAHELAVELAELRERRDELERLLGAERSRRERVEEQLSEARLQPTVPSGEVERAEALAAEVDRERSRAERVEAELEELRARAAASDGEEARQRARAEQAEAALRGAQEREDAAVVEECRRAERAEADAARARADADAAQAEANAVRERLESERSSMSAALEQARLYALRATAAGAAEAQHEPEPEAEPVPEPAAPTTATTRSRPTWSGHAQHTLTAALAHASEWRTGLRDAVKVLGVEGGWDAVSAWLPEERRPSLKCTAMWLAEPDGRAVFETQTWQRPHSISGTELGHVFTSGESAWLTGIAESDDDRLLTAVEEGMSTALLVPVCEGPSSLAVLELLSRRTAAPDPDVAESIAAVGLQLGHFSHLLRAGAQPHWRLGKF